PSERADVPGLHARLRRRVGRCAGANRGGLCDHRGNRERAAPIPVAAARRLAGPQGCGPESDRGGGGKGKRQGLGESDQLLALRPPPPFPRPPPPLTRPPPPPHPP